METMKKEEIKQAIVIAEAFHKNFLPIRSQAAFLPLANKNIIEYTFHWLSLCGIEEVVYFCPAKTDNLKEYVENRRWIGITVKILVYDNCHTLGDAMRAIDRYGAVTGDFVLLSADVIGNVNLIPILKKFKKLKIRDGGAAMMNIFTQTDKIIKNSDEESVVLVFDEYGQIKYHKFGKRKDLKKLEIPMESILSERKLEFRMDLRNTGVAICSSAVPPLFSDNFDYQSINDFVRGTVMNDEICTETVYCHVLRETEYLTRINNWRRYECITRDYLYRMFYPVVPDVLDASYSRGKNCTYLNTNVTFKKGSRLGCDVIIDSNCDIARNAEVTASTIGANCKIGENVIVANSFVFDNVAIGDGCVISHSVIAENCVIEPSCVIKNAALGSGVTVVLNSEVVNLKLISRRNVSNPNRYKDFNKTAVIFTRTNEDEGSDSEDVTDSFNLLAIGDSSDKTDDSSSDESDSSADEPTQILDDVSIFYNEVSDSLLRGFEEKANCENLILEINSSRHAYNVSVDEMNYNVTKSILCIVPATELTSNAQMLFGKVKYFTPLLQNYIKNEADQIECLNAIKDVCFLDEMMIQWLPKLVHLLYEEDVLAEEGIMTWYNDLGDAENQIREKLRAFIDWLKDADEED